MRTDRANPGRISKSDTRRMLSREAMLWLSPLKDLVMAAIWPYCAVSRSVEWRGRRLRFGFESRLRPDTEGPLVVRVARRLVG